MSRAPTPEHKERIDGITFPLLNWFGLNWFGPELVWKKKFSLGAQICASIARSLGAKTPDFFGALPAIPMDYSALDVFSSCGKAHRGVQRCLLRLDLPGRGGGRDQF